mgnify:CR=1 FL=1
MKKRHWTQTPQGKAKLAKAVKNGWKAKHKQENGNGNGTSGDPSETQVAYVFGRVEGFIEAFASSRGLSRPALASRVGALLRKQANG